MVSDGSSTDGVVECFFVDVFSFEVSHHDVFVNVGEYFKKFRPVFLGFTLQVIGDFDDVVTCSEVFALPDDCLHGHKVNYACKVCFDSDGKLQDCNVGV